MGAVWGRLGVVCGRYAYPDEDLVVTLLNIDAVLGDRMLCSGDVRPTQQIRIVTEGDATSFSERKDGRRVLRSARWGLIPQWTKAFDKTRLLINARAETLVSKPSFRASAQARRAVIPASGYYEWQPNPDGSKTPFFLDDPDQPAIGFAGVYDWWELPEGISLPGAESGCVCSAAIITRPATDSLGHIHDRMPVVIPSDMVDTWLDPRTTDADEVDAILHAIPDPVLVPTPRQPG